MDIDTLKKLAGINEFTGYKPVSLENISDTAQALKDKEKRLGIKPGDADWFKIWFSKPYLNGPIQFRSRKK
jgi:hypothetical protein|tara:strand:- start:677 stop:889 length:213 start_codon:yes stop_codon:yes gene_type:complete